MQTNQAFDAIALRTALLLRGVKLNPPASDASLSRLEIWAGAPLDHGFVEVYRQFDGFADGSISGSAFVSVWRIEKMLDQKRSERPEICFADWFIEAFHFFTDPTSAGKVTFDLDSKVEIPTFERFWEIILADDEYALGI